MAADQLLSIDDLAARWRVSRSTIKRLICRRELQTERVGAQVRIRESVAEAYLVARSTPALAPLAVTERAGHRVRRRA